MATRKNISKKTRFEVFKRDKFTCQYCGRSAPDVILEVDHIMPVAKGGTNDIMNLITSCKDCNRGKKDIPLSDNQVIEKQKKQLDELQEKREQLEMMLKWKEELQNMDEKMCESIENKFRFYTKCDFNSNGEKEIIKLIKKYGFEEVYESTEISCLEYYDGSDKSVGKTFNGISTICYNRKMQREKPYWKDFCYCKKIITNKFGYRKSIYYAFKPLEDIYKFRYSGNETIEGKDKERIEEIKSQIKQATNFNALCEYLDAESDKEFDRAWDRECGREVD